MYAVQDISFAQFPERAMPWPQLPKFASVALTIADSQMLHRCINCHLSNFSVFVLRFELNDPICSHTGLALWRIHLNSRTNKILVHG
jgi:hypothetical protein